MPNMHWNAWQPKAMEANVRQRLAMRSDALQFKGYANVMQSNARTASYALHELPKVMLHPIRSRRDPLLHYTAFRSFGKLPNGTRYVT